MDDEKIIELFWQRNEDAITETASKYGKLCRFISANILSRPEDCEEVVNATYLAAWNSIPRQRPKRFSVFISRIARNLALKRYDYNAAAKRNPEAVCSLEELAECVSGRANVENEAEDRRVEELISAFLWQQPEERRAIFIRRYWYFEPIADISRRTGYSESKVKSLLSRMRQSLKEYLEQEGVEL